MAENHTIRITAKALIIHDGKVLLNHGHWYHGDAYDLPGGGQHKFETMEEALVREVLEETGYTVRPIRLIAVKEEIFTDPYVREKWTEYSHRLNHVFLAEMIDVPRKEVTEVDRGTEEFLWLPFEKLTEIKGQLFPRGLVDALPKILNEKTCVVLPTHYLDDRLEGM